MQLRQPRGRLTVALVLVDLDGTLIHGPSSEQRFILYLIGQRALGMSALTTSLGFAARHVARYGRHVWKRNKSYLAGLDVETVQILAERFVARLLERQQCPQMRRRIAYHNAMQDDLVLLTGAPEFIARPVARALGIPDSCATVCAQRDGRFIAAKPRRHPFGSRKARLARRLATDLGMSMADAVAYADSIDDLPLLCAVGRPVAVHPDRRLGHEARCRGWEVLEC